MTQISTIAVLLAFVLPACAAPTTSRPSATSPVATGMTVPPEASPTAIGSATALPTATAARPATPTALPTTPEPAVQSDNLFAIILGTVTAPEGWAVRPCEGDASLLCVWEGEEAVGTAELMLYPIETLPDFQEMLSSAGVEPGPLEEPAPEFLAALQEFVADYHTSFETDRQAEYGDRVRYSRLETQEVMVGEMPGLRYGFAGLEPDGGAYERWVTTVAFDGELLYILVAFYRPGEPSSFRSDADLQEFLPQLTPIVARLQLPIPVLQTEVNLVRTLRDLEIFRAYGVPGNPVGQVVAGQPVLVTGVSLNRRYWRVDCPAGTSGHCWISAGPDATEPTP